MVTFYRQFYSYNIWVKSYCYERFSPVLIIVNTMLSEFLTLYKNVHLFIYNIVLRRAVTV